MYIGRADIYIIVPVYRVTPINIIAFDFSLKFLLLRNRDGLQSMCSITQLENFLKDIYWFYVYLLFLFYLLHELNIAALFSWHVRSFDILACLGFKPLPLIFSLLIVNSKVNQLIILLLNRLLVHEDLLVNFLQFFLFLEWTHVFNMFFVEVVPEFC